jgi:hypothetical protein
MADGDIGGARDDPNAPIFPGRPAPKTARALFDECEEALRLVDSSHVGIEHRAAAALFMRWQGAMRAIGDAEPEPYPEWLRRELPAYLQQSSMWTPVSSMNLELLADSINAHKKWCKTQMADEALRAAARASKRPDKKRDKRKRISKKRQVTVAAADCARLYKQRKRRDASVRMKHVVEDYAVEHDQSGLSIMRVLNDHPELWKDEKGDKKATKRRH